LVFVSLLLANSEGGRVSSHVRGMKNRVVANAGVGVGIPLCTAIITAVQNHFIPGKTINAGVDDIIKASLDLGTSDKNYENFICSIVDAAFAFAKPGISAAGIGTAVGTIVTNSINLGLEGKKPAQPPVVLPVTAPDIVACVAEGVTAIVTIANSAPSSFIQSGPLQPIAAVETEAKVTLVQDLCTTSVTGTGATQLEAKLASNHLPDTLNAPILAMLKEACAVVGSITDFGNNYKKALTVIKTTLPAFQPALFTFGVTAFFTAVFGDVAAFAVQLAIVSKIVGAAATPPAANVGHHT